MAFNPFHSFRKHKKVVFATLTIICMFTFVLSSGLGGRMDLFTELPNMIGIGRAREKYAKDKEDKVVKVYGDKVKLEDLAELRQERALAISCLMKSIQYAQSELAKEQSKLFEKSLDPTGFQQQQMQYQQKQQLLATAQIRNLLYFVDQNELYQLLFLLQQAPDRVAQAIGQTQPVERLLDFMIWRHQADKLGIYLTDADIENEVRRQTLSNATVEGIHGAIASEFPKTNVDRVYKVLGDELRVRLAMAAMMGYDAGDWSAFSQRDRNKEVKQVPAPFTPYDFWEFYKDNRTTVEVALLPIRVEDLVKDLTETPSDKALKKLYDRGKDRVYDPNSSEPGFKEPQRIKVEYVGARPDSSYYKRVAEAVIAASHITDPTAFNVYLLDKARGSEFLLPSWYSPYSYTLSPQLDFNKPENVAGMLGQVLGAAGGQETVFSALWGLSGTAITRQNQWRLDTGLSLLLAGTDPLPFAAAGVTYYAQQKRYLPLEVAKKQILEKLQTETARKILEDNLQKLDQALGAVNALPEADRKMAADEAVFNAIQDYGLTVHQVMEQPRDRHTIHEDKTLQPLKDAHDKERFSVRSDEEKKRRFVELLFQGPYQGRNLPLYSPQQMTPPILSSSDKAGDYFLYWKVEDKPGEVRSYRDAEADVKKAWLLDRAREEADKKAQKLAEEVRDKKMNISELRDYCLNQKRELIEPNVLGRIARKMPAPSLRADAGRLYEPYKFPEKVTNPNANFVDKLLGLKEKGDTVVLRDNPKKVYYVAVLTERDPPTVAEFYEIYKNGVPSLFASTKQDPLLDEFIVERRRKYVENFIRQLRIDSGASNDKGYYEISKETKERIEGRAGGEPGDEG